jgi:hypothetical protein
MKAWNTSTSCNCDAKDFDDPAWAKGTQLRNGFDKLINGPEMVEALNGAPKGCTQCCGGCHNVEVRSEG